MKDLEVKYRKKNLLGGVFFLIVGLVISLLCFKDYIPSGEVQDLDMIMAEDIHEGSAKITVYDIYDYYSYWTDSYGKETTRAYFVAMGDGEETVYMGCELTGKKNDRAYDIMEKWWSYDENPDQEIDYDSLDYFTVKGKVKRIEGEDLRYFTEYLDELRDYYGLTQAEIDEHFIPYVITPAKVGDGDTYGIVGAIFGIGFVICAIGMICCGIFGNPLKDIKDYCKKTVNPELTMSRIERFHATTPERYGVQANDEYFMFTGGTKPVFCDAKDVLWFYQYVVTRKTNFVTVGKDYFVRFRLANGKQVDTAAKKETVIDILNYFTRVLPDSIVGYTDQLDLMYRKNRQQMIDEVERRHHTRTGTSCMHEDNDNFEEQKDYEFTEASLDPKDYDFNS